MPCSNVDALLHAKQFCRLCNGVIEFTTTENRAKLRVSSKGVDLKIKHEASSKAYITGDFRSKVIEMLKLDAPGIVVSKLSNELKNKNDGHCSILPKRSTLTQMKYRANKKLKNFRHESALLAICKMSEEPAYLGCIDDIGAKPFSVYYGTPAQKAKTRALSKKNTTTISIDATGCCGRPPAESQTSEKTGRKKVCFYYALTVQKEKGSYTAYQMVSQSHSSHKIGHWLTSWKINNHSNADPLVVIVDESAALLSAVAQSFADTKSMNEYLSKCHDHLEDDKERPNCYIRLDRSHTVKTILRNKNFKRVFGAQNSARHFYLRVIGFLLLQSDWTLMKEVIRNTFRLALDPEPGPEGKMTEMKMVDLTRTHRIYSEADNETEKEDPKNELFDSQFVIRRSKFYHFIERIATDVRETLTAKYQSESDEEEKDDSLKVTGRFYAPDIVPTLIEIFSKLPLTSCILNESFGLPPDQHPTSSATEAHFRVMNNDLFKRKKMDMDRWLETSLKYLLGISKADEEVDEDAECCVGSESREDEYDPKSSDEMEFYSDCGTESDYDSEESAEATPTMTSEKAGAKKDDFDDKLKHENFMGQNDDAKKELTRFKGRTKFSILNPKSAPVVPIPMFKNCFTVSMGKRQVITYQACAPNSIVHVFLALYKDSGKVKNEIDGLDDAFSTLIKTTINEQIIDKAYKLRANLLVDCYSAYCNAFDDHIKETMAKSNDIDYIAQMKEKLIRSDHFKTEDDNIISLNCDQSLYTVLTMLSTKTSFFCMKEVTVCESCNVTQKVRITPSCPIDINAYGPTDIQGCLLEERYESKTICTECKIPVTIKRIPSRILVLDIENMACLSEDDPEKRTILLGAISKKVTFAGRTFLLKAVIEHLKGGHFVSFIQRSNEWLEYDDLNTAAANVPAGKKVAASMLVYLMEESEDNEHE